MAPDKEKPRVIKGKRQDDMDSDAFIEILTNDLNELEPESSGYDPYDNPGPVPDPSAE